MKETIIEKLTNIVINKFGKEYAPLIEVSRVTKPHIDADFYSNIAMKLAKYLLNFCEKKNWKLIGPAPSLIAKVGKKFRWQILIHGPEGTKIPLPDRSILWKLIPKNVFLTIDLLQGYQNFLL